MSGIEWHVVTHEESLNIAASYLREAMRYLQDGDTEHALVWIDDALLWMGRQ